MNKADTSLKLRIFVVGNSVKNIVSDVIKSLKAHKIDIEVCDDIYTLIGRSAKSEIKSLLVIGSLRQLAKEQGRFFKIARNNGLACCCVINGGKGYRAEEILSAIKAGAFVVSKPSDVVDAIEKLLLANETLPSESSKVQSSIGQESVTTKEEIDTLLGNIDE